MYLAPTPFGFGAFQDMGAYMYSLKRCIEPYRVHDPIIESTHTRMHAHTHARTHAHTHIHTHSHMHTHQRVREEWRMTKTWNPQTPSPGWGQTETIHMMRYIHTSRISLMSAARAHNDDGIFIVGKRVCNFLFLLW